MTSQHNKLTAAIAQELGTYFYDIAAHMPKDDEHFPDGFHVSQIGSDLKRDLYFRYLEESGLIEKIVDERRGHGIERLVKE